MTDMSIINRVNTIGFKSNTVNSEKSFAPTQNPIDIIGAPRPRNRDEAMEEAKRKAMETMTGAKELAYEMMALLNKNNDKEFASMPKLVADINKDISKMSEEDIKQWSEETIKNMDRVLNESKQRDLSNWNTTETRNGQTIKRSNIDEELYFEEIEDKSGKRAEYMYYKDGSLLGIGYEDADKEVSICRLEEFGNAAYKDKTKPNSPKIELLYKQKNDGIEYSTKVKTMKYETKNETEGRM